MSSFRALRTGFPASACFLAYHIEIIVRAMLSTPIGIEEANAATSPDDRPPEDVLELDGVAIIPFPVKEVWGIREEPANEVDEEVIDEEVVDEEVIDEEVVDEEVIDKEVVDEEVVDEEVVDEEVVDKEVVDEEVVDKEVVDKEVVDKEVMDEEVVDKEVVDKEVVDEEVVEKKVVEEAVEDPLPVLLVAGPIENKLLVAKFWLKSLATKARRT